MVLTRIQCFRTQGIIQYRVNGVRTTKQKYEEAEKKHLTFRVGCYSLSTTSRSRNGNYIHKVYLSI
jgi:hypothetical protein